MQTLDRKIAPAYKAVEKIDLIHANETKLSNNISVYAINGGTQEVIKIEFVFKAGMYEQSRTLQASTTNAMLEEGTSKMSASEIADAIDYYGAFLECSAGQDNASITLYTLSKYLGNTLPIIEQILKEPSFPENELNTMLANKKQKYFVNNQKVASLARRRFSELIFGEKHPYGIDVKEQDFDTLSKKQLLDFYSNYYHAENCKIFISGKIDTAVIPMLEKHFGGNDWKKETIQHKEIVKAISSSEKQHLVYKEDALQSAIRIGKLLFNKTHTDFLPMLVLNTVFGGYFGSRLMSNIREDKGYTYGIGSGIVSLKNEGYFFISTEVGVDVCSNALNEIYLEMDKLKSELIPDEELQLVKNYMLGTFLRSVDGPFAMADKFKGIQEYGLGYDYYDKYIATIQNIKASELRELANQYLQKESMIELVAGKK